MVRKLYCAVLCDRPFFLPLSSFPRSRPFLLGQRRVLLTVENASRRRATQRHAIIRFGLPPRRARQARPFYSAACEKTANAY